MRKIIMQNRKNREAPVSEMEIPYENISLGLVLTMTTAGATLFNCMLDTQLAKDSSFVIKSFNAFLILFYEFIRKLVYN